MVSPDQKQRIPDLTNYLNLTNRAKTQQSGFVIDSEAHKEFPNLSEPLQDDVRNGNIVYVGSNGGVAIKKINK